MITSKRRKNLTVPMEFKKDNVTRGGKISFLKKEDIIGLLGKPRNNIALISQIS